MATRAGERARKTEDLVCDQCGSTMHVDKGDDVARCPSCDGETFGSGGLEQQERREHEREPGRGAPHAR